MSNIEKFSNLIASRILKTLCIDDKDKEEVLAYGAFVLFQTILITLMVALFGIIFKVLLEALVILFIASFLRKSSGGAHATSPMNCALISVIIFGGIALIVKHYIMNLVFSHLIIGMILAFIFTYYIMLNYSPVETENKPLRNNKVKARLKKKSINIVLSLVVMNLILILLFSKTKSYYLLNIAVCITLGVTWQSITMVSLGHKIIDGLDKVLSGTKRLKRRINQ